MPATAQHRPPLLTTGPQRQASRGTVLGSLSGGQRSGSRACTCLLSGTVVDEASIIKHWSGATQKAITRFVSKHQYRLLCTATPAPNDFVELGKREGVNMEMEGQWNGQLKLAEAPPEGTAFVLYVSDEPLAGTEQRRQASQIQGVVE